MSILDDLLVIYKQSNIKIKPPKNPNKKPLEFGDIIEIYHDTLMIAVYIGDDTAILMSEFYEFATNTDMIVYIRPEHPVSNKWIIELDKRLFLNEKTTVSYYTKLSQEDANILKQVLDGAILPPEKSGSKLPLNLKDPRYKFKLEELKKTLKFNKDIFFEKDINIINFDFTKDLFSAEKKAAFDAKKSFKKNDVDILINPKSVIIDTSDKSIGKYAKIYLKLEKKEIIIFEGIIETPTFEIISKTHIKNTYGLHDILQVDIYDDKP